MSLQTLYSWLLFCSIVLPLLGGICGLGAWFISGKLDEERKGKIEYLEKLSKPRIISFEQKTAILTVLKKYPKGKVWITAPDGDQECKTYAVQIADAFRNAGLDVSWGGQIGVRFANGLSIFSEGQPNALFASAIIDAFKAAGIDCPRSELSTLKDHALINIMVGIRK